MRRSAWFLLAAAALVAVVFLPLRHVHRGSGDEVAGDLRGEDRAPDGTPAEHYAG